MTGDPVKLTPVQRRRADRKAAAEAALAEARAGNGRSGPMIEVVDPSRIVSVESRPPGVPPWVPRREWQTWQPNDEADRVTACWSKHVPQKNVKRSIGRAY